MGQVQLKARIAREYSSTVSSRRLAARTQTPRADRADGLDGVGLRRRLVLAVALHASEAKRHRRRVVRALLHVPERHLHDDLRFEMDRVAVGRDGDLLEALR